MPSLHGEDEFSFVCSFVLSRNAVWTGFCLVLSQFPTCNCSASNILRTTQTVLTCRQFSSHRRHGQDETACRRCELSTRRCTFEYCYSY